MARCADQLKTGAGRPGKPLPPPMLVEVRGVKFPFVPVVRAR